MKVPNIPDNETDRLCSLYKLAILDTEPEQRFDVITLKVKQYFDVSFALISIVDAERQWFKSNQGVEAKETHREISFCGHAINYDQVFYVENALEDERFYDNPLVTGYPHIRFYAGAPIKSPEGHAIGTLCIIDQSPRSLTENDITVLMSFAGLVEQELRNPPQ